MAIDTTDNKTLEQRLRLIEDRLEIYNLIASHPPSADTGAGDYTASVWTEDGVFDRGAEFARPTGRAAIASGSSNPEHHRAIEQGIAHFCRLALCANCRRHGLCDLLFADPRAGPRRSAIRRPQSWLIAWFPRAPRFGQSLGLRSH